MRTRVKICGLTRPADVVAAVQAGADAVGFVCWPGSPRHVSYGMLPALVRDLPPFVVPVLLFVNQPAVQVQQALATVPQALMQFHGDEPSSFCQSFGRPYVRAMPVGEGGDLLDFETKFASASGILCDAPAPGTFGGSGTVFDWSRLPTVAQRSKPLVLAGGLHAGNVAEAIRQVRPYAVDVSSGVEAAGAKGIKDPERIRSFLAAVRGADERSA